MSTSIITDLSALGQLNVGKFRGNSTFYTAGIDIGGTNVRIAIFDNHGKKVSDTKLKTSNFSNSKELVAGVLKFLDQPYLKNKILGVAFAMGGPYDKANKVHDLFNCGVGKFPLEEVANDLHENGIPVLGYLNDMEGQGWGAIKRLQADTLELKDLTEPGHGMQNFSGDFVYSLMNPGTGLGKGHGVVELDHITVLMDESCHNSGHRMSDRRKQPTLDRFIKEAEAKNKWAFESEDIISGRGIVQSYLITNRLKKLPPEIANENDYAAKIVDLALEDDPKALKAMEFYIDYFAVNARNSVQGCNADIMLLSGNCKSEEQLYRADDRFMRAFYRSARLRDSVLNNARVSVIQNPDGMGEEGAAYYLESRVIAPRSIPDQFSLASSASNLSAEPESNGRHSEKPAVKT